MITTYNHTQDVKEHLPYVHLLTFGEISLLVVGLLAILKIGGMPQPAGIAMLSLGGVCIGVDIWACRRLSSEIPPDTEKKVEFNFADFVIKIKGFGNLPIYTLDEFKDKSLVMGRHQFFFFYPEDVEASFENIACYRGSGDGQPFFEKLKDADLKCFHHKSSLNGFTYIKKFVQQEEVTEYFNVAAGTGQTAQDLRASLRL